MPSQREIAKALRISVATVSLALRGSRLISTRVRDRVLKKAQQMGYRQNAYVHALMTQVRSGRKICNQGTIALLVDKCSEEEWFLVKQFQKYHQAVVQRGHELGFQVECFFLRAPGMNAERIDAILYARGIQGLIFAPPYLRNGTLSMQWERYACLGGSYPWARQDFDFVSTDHAYNVRLAFEELRRLGYARIGMLLSSSFMTGVQWGPRWLSGYLEAQYNLPVLNQIPAFQVDPGWTDACYLRCLKEWYAKWKPDVMLALDFIEWLDRATGLRFPEDCGFAYYDLCPGSSASGVNENFDIVGAVAVEQVVAKMARNEYGVPACPKQTLIHGRWVSGTTTRKQG